MTEKSKIRKLDKPVDKHLLKMVDDIRELVLKGDIKGIIFFAALAGQEVFDGSAGEMNLSEVILAFENWKWKQLFQQNVTEK
jgi:hypothetical protein